MAESATIGGVSVDVRANLAPYRADLRGAEAEAQRFSTVAQRGMDGTAAATGRATKAQDGFSQSITQSNVIYADFTKKLAEQQQTIDKLTDSLAKAQQQQQQYQQAQTASTAAVDETNKSVTNHIIGWATLTNHLRLVAAAALFVAPAIKSAIGPAVAANVAAVSAEAKIAGAAISSMMPAAVVTGLKVGVDGIKAIGPAAVTAGRAVLTALTPAFSFWLSIAGPIALAATFYKLGSAAVDASTKVAELNKLASKSDFSTEFFLHAAAGAEKLKLKTEDVLKTLEKFSEAARPKTLGGGGNLDELIKNSGVISNTASLEVASTVEAKWRAVLPMIKAALDSGQRLGALDLASKFFPSDIVRRLALSSDYLEKMQRTADNMAIIDPATIRKAAELTERLDAAWSKVTLNTIDLSSLGNTLRSIWVTIVETMGGATSLIDKALAGMGWLITQTSTAIDKLDEWAQRKKPGMSAAGVGFGGEFVPGGLPQDIDFTAGELPERLGGLAQFRQQTTPEAIKAGMGESIEHISKVFGDATNAAKDFNAQIDKLKGMGGDSFKVEQLADKFKNAQDAFNTARAKIFAEAQTGTPDVKKLEELDKVYNKVLTDLGSTPKEADKAKDAWDRATEAAARNAATMEGDAKSIGLGAGAHAKFRVEAQLTEAALRAGVDIVGQRAKDFEKLANRANKAADALERLKLSDDTRFDLQKLGLNDTDASVADKLRPIFGKDTIDNLNGAEAAAVRFNLQLQGTKSLMTDIVGGGLKEFRNALMNGATAWDAFKQAGVSALNKIADKLIDMATSNLMAQAFGGKSGGGGFLASLFGGGSSGASPQPGEMGFIGPVQVARSGGMVGSISTTQLVDHSIFQNAPHFDRGGSISDDGVPIIAHPGERILNKQETSEYNKGQQASPANTVYMSNDFRGAAPEAVAALKSQINQLARAVQQMPQTIAATMALRPTLSRG